MKTEVKTTKFPYIFWFFNKSYLCEVNFKTKEYTNLEVNTNYKIKEFNYYGFLILKYLPILVLFYFSFSIYDFMPNKIIIISYVLAFLLMLNVNFLEHLSRKIGIGIILFVALIVGYMLGNVFLVCALSLKYFILLSVILLLFIDSKNKCFCLLKGNKVVSHFLINKHFLEKHFEKKD